MDMGPATEESDGERAGELMSTGATQRAKPPVPPPLSREAARAEEERGIYRREREGVERRSVLRGLILLAAIVVLFTLWHGGAGRAFPAGWWQRW